MKFSSSAAHLLRLLVVSALLGLTACSAAQPAGSSTTSTTATPSATTTPPPPTTLPDLVETSDPGTLAAADQTTDGTYVTITAAVPPLGFLVVTSADDPAGQLADPVLVTSEIQTRTVALTERLTAPTDVEVSLWRDANLNGRLDPEDPPASDAAGDPLVRRFRLSPVPERLGARAVLADPPFAATPPVSSLRFSELRLPYGGYVVVVAGGKVISRSSLLDPHDAVQADVEVAVGSPLPEGSADLVVMFLADDGDGSFSGLAPAEFVYVDESHDPLTVELPLTPTSTTTTTTTTTVPSFPGP